VGVEKQICSRDALNTSVSGGELDHLQELKGTS
jgi:hypothetical protein